MHLISDDTKSINALTQCWQHAPTSKPLTREDLENGPAKVLCFATDPEPRRGGTPQRLNDFEDQVRAPERPQYPPGRKDDKGDKL